MLCKIKVNDPRTAAFTNACAWEGHAGLSKAARASNEDSLFGIGNKLKLKNGVVVIGQFRHSSGKGRKLDEQHTLYYSSAPIISGSEVDYVDSWRRDKRPESRRGLGCNNCPVMLEDHRRRISHLRGC